MPALSDLNGAIMLRSALRIRTTGIS